VLLAAVVAAPPAVRAQAPTVSANGEHLDGLWANGEEDVAEFLGIPFAAPPVGELRWRAPQPHEARSGRQAATQFAPACMQGPHIVDWYARVAAAFGAGRDEIGNPNGVSEDCLYLNVWTPNLPASGTSERLPVMVWFHGGSNKGGWSYEPNYLGAKLAARNVVVVTTAYRLGPFGFFSHPSLADSQPGEPIANFGFLDQIAALEWVRAHIESFGGDPDNVTCFGESSGAGDLGNMFVTNIDLCRQIIAQSPGGSYALRKTLADAQANGLRIAAELNIENDDAAAHRLRAVPAREIIAAADTALPGHYFDVVTDDKTLVEAPLESLDRQQQSKISFLIGTNRDEWYMYLDEDTAREDIGNWLAEHAPGYATELQEQVADEADPRRALDKIRTARNMRCPARRVAARINATGGRAWIYHFTRQRAGPGGEKLGAYHGTEIPYVFGTHDDWLPVEAIDIELTDAVMDYWVQFARSGDPNLPGLPDWPVYTAEEPAVLELGEQIRAITPVDAALCLWLGPA
jgi:para-nitrobenzyl esterase